MNNTEIIVIRLFESVRRLDSSSQILSAARRLVLQSDTITLSNNPPKKKVEFLANEVYKYIILPCNTGEYLTFADNISESLKADSFYPNHDPLVISPDFIEEFLVGLLYSYKTCACLKKFFPFSALREFIDAWRIYRETEDGLVNQAPHADEMLRRIIFALRYLDCAC